MDPISEEELRRSTRVKQYQQYQNYVDSLDNADKKDSSETSKIGKMKGKTIKRISEEGSPMREIFNRYAKKDFQTPESQK
jgi:hypothetical protein